MSAEQENFEQLRRLLAFKRHEQPPPGYFDSFSRQVITRIQAGETSANHSPLGRWLAPLSRLLGGFEAKPIVAGAFGVGVCGLLVIGLVSSERMDGVPPALAPNNETPQPIFANVPNNQSGVGSLFDRAVAERVGADHSLTGSVFTAQGPTSLFDELTPSVQRVPRVQRVDFSLPASGN